jgi:hypothetical protein
MNDSQNNKTFIMLAQITNACRVELTYLWGKISRIWLMSMTFGNAGYPTKYKHIQTMWNVVNCHNISIAPMFWSKMSETNTYDYTQLFLSYDRS